MSKPPLPPVLPVLRSAQPLAWGAAHQGCRDAAPGNTEAALRCAVEHRAPLIEIDLRTSKDGILHLLHDRHLRALLSLPASQREARLTDLGSKDLERACYDDDSTHCLVTFEKAVELVAGGQSVLQLDLKEERPETVRRILAVVNKHGASEQIVVQCQALESLAYVRKHAPGLAVLARIHSRDEIARALKLRPEIVQVDPELLSPRLVHQIHAAGSRLLVKALGERDTEGGWCALLTDGADILLTDHIERFNERRDDLGRECRFSEAAR